MMGFTVFRASCRNYSFAYSAALLRRRAKNHQSRSFASPAIVELREYALHPEHVSAYLQVTSETAHLRKLLRFFSLPETGGRLNIATHVYYYAGGQGERDDTRKKLAENSEWQSYRNKSGQYIHNQSSTLWVEAPLVKEHVGVLGLSMVPVDQPGDNAILELRRYKLKLGYDTVPKFLDLYSSGLASKLSNQDPTTSLLSVLYTEVGRLNEVVEIWRHGNGPTAMNASRQAARNAQEWRSAISNIADLAIEFTNTIHKPTDFSPIQ